MCVAAACGGSDAEGYDYGRACRLFSDDEAAAVLGVAVHPGEVDDDRTIPESFCVWVARGSSTSPGEAGYAVFISEGTERFSLDEFNRDRRRRDAVEVEGVGDDAYFHSPGRLPFLNVLVGEHAVTIGVEGDADHPVTTREAQQIERAVAKIIVSRL